MVYIKNGTLEKLKMYGIIYLLQIIYFHILANRYDKASPWYKACHSAANIKGTGEKSNRHINMKRSVANHVITPVSVWKDPKLLVGDPIQK